MDMVDWLNTIAGYGFFTVPLLICFFWTWWGNWYTYNLGWLIMILDLGLWMVDLPSTLHHIFHSLNTATFGWKWYFVIAEYIVLTAMTWRGFVMIKELYQKRKEVADDGS